MPSTLHDGVSVDAGMNTSYQKSLAACKDRRAMGNGDRMTGGVSLVSKFKVTNFVLIEDEEVSCTHESFHRSNQNCADSPRSFGIGTSAPVWTYSWDRGTVVLNSPNGALGKKKSVFGQ